jgi:hypothetical protein
MAGSMQRRQSYSDQDKNAIDGMQEVTDWWNAHNKVAYCSDLVHFTLDQQAEVVEIQVIGLVIKGILTVASGFQLVGTKNRYHDWCHIHLLSNFKESEQQHRDQCRCTTAHN